MIAYLVFIYLKGVITLTKNQASKSSETKKRIRRTSDIKPKVDPREQSSFEKVLAYAGLFGMYGNLN